MKKSNWNISLSIVLAAFSGILIIACEKNHYLGPDSSENQKTESFSHNTTDLYSSVTATSSAKLWVEATSSHVASCNGSAGKCSRASNSTTRSVANRLIKISNDTQISSYFNDNKDLFVGQIPDDIYSGTVKGIYHIMKYEGHTAINTKYIMFKDVNEETMWVLEIMN